MKNQTELDLKKLKPHPLGTIFPPLGDEEYLMLKQSIKQNGYRADSPVYLFEGQILDGNNRYTAAKSVKAEPVFKNYTGDDPIGFVVSQNLARRHLSPSQAAALGADLADRLKAEEEAQKEAAKQAAKEAKAAGKKVAPVKAKRAKGAKAAKAAKALGVSERSVASAAALKKADPEGFKAVKEGKKTLHKANTEAGIKQSAADRKTAAFEDALKRIDTACGEGSAAALKDKLAAKDILKLSEIDASALKAALPLLQVGWKIKDALGYKSVTIGAAHPIRSLIDRSVLDNYGDIEVEVELYGKQWSIIATHLT